MNISTIIRAWKDESFRLGLTTAEQAMLPENPAGVLELSDTQLGAVNGAGIDSPFISTALCPTPTHDLRCLPEPKTPVPPTNKKGTAS